MYDYINYLNPWKDIKILSANVNSLNLSNNNEKLNEKVVALSQEGADIILLQDVRASDKKYIIENKFMCTKGGNFAVYTNSSKDSRGVTTLIRNSSGITVKEIIDSTDENYSIIKLEKQDKIIVICNCYGPTQTDDPEFFKNLKISLNRFYNLPVYIIGDLNAITDYTKPDPDNNVTNKEILGTLHIPNPRNSKLLARWHSDGDYYDIFRTLNPNKVEYSYIGFRGRGVNNNADNHIQRSRIDLVLGNEKALNLVGNIEYKISSSLFDHKFQMIKLKSPKDRGPPMMNMNIVQEIGTKEIIHLSLINTICDYLPDHDIPAPILSSIRKTAVDISTVVAENKKRKDKLFPFILNSLIRDYWSKCSEIPPIEIFFGQDFTIDPSLFLQTLLNNINVEVASFQANFCKAKNINKDNLYKSLNDVLKSRNPDLETLYEIEEMIRELEQNIINEKCKRSKSWDTLNLEKGSKAFCAISKSAKNETTFDVLKNCSTVPPTDFISEEEKNEHATGFYQHIFRDVDGEINLSIEEFLGDTIANSDYVKDKKLSNEEKNVLDSPLTIHEIKDVIQKCNSNSAPGHDNFTYNFIKIYFEFLKYPMIRAFNHFIEEGKVTHNFSISKIKLIPKKDCLENIKSWRPISLLSVFYKVFSGCVAERLKTVLDKICSPCQKGYSSTKNINEVSLNVNNMIKAANENNIEMSIISIDFKKAFDSLSHSYIIKALEFFNFGPFFLKLITACLKGKKAYISNLKSCSTMIDVNSGAAQGDKPSGPLFNISLEPLLILIEKCPLIEDVTIPGNPEEEGPEQLLGQRLTVYADDMNPMVKSTEANILRIKEILTNFAKVSALHANIEKTSICPINSSPEFENFITAQGFRIEKEFKLLGIYYDHKGTNIDKKNMEICLNKIDSIIEFWKKCYLTIPGKVSVLKTFVYSQLSYFAPSINFDTNFCSEVEKKIVKFIGTSINAGPDKCFQTTDTGGLGLFKVDDYITSIRVSFFKRHLNSNDSWATSIKEASLTYNELIFPYLNHLEKYYPCSAELVKSYNKFKQSFFSHPENLTENHLLYNQEVKDRGQVLIPENFTELLPSIEVSNFLHNFKIFHLIDERTGNPLNRIQFNQKFDLNFQANSYSKILRASYNIRKQYSRSDVKHPTLRFYIKSKKKLSKIFRKFLKPAKKMSKILSFKPTKTRANKMNFVCDIIPETALYKVWCNSKLPNEIRNFLYKLSQNSNKLNVHINKFKPVVSPLCSSCSTTGPQPNSIEDMVHIYLNCPFVHEIVTEINNNVKIAFKIDIKNYFVNNAENKISATERTIIGILIYSITQHRNKVNNKKNIIKDSFRNYINSLAWIDKHFKLRSEMIFNPHFI